MENEPNQSQIIESAQIRGGHSRANVPPCDFCGCANSRKRSRYCSVRCTDRAYRRRVPYRRNEQNRKYRVKNRARIRRNQKQWRAENPNYWRDYYAKHREREIARALAGKLLRRSQNKPALTNDL